MGIEIVALVLFSSVLHAGWNALVKVQGERVIIMAMLVLFSSILAIATAPFVEVPDSSSWTLLVLGVLLHVGYNIFLPVAYNHGNLNQVYPIARGTAPLLVAVCAFVFVGETIALWAVVGVICIATGVIALTFEHGNGLRKNPRAVVYALITSMFIAAYTIIDGMGARQSGSALGFAVWLTIGDGIITFLIVLAWKGRIVFRVVGRNKRVGVLGAGMQTCAYWIIIWAFSIAPLAMVSGVRETSVLMAAFLSTVLLKERIGAWRILATCLVAAGLIVMHID
jgi:drug/metabolite transporter (DMT)-like permease